MLWGLPTVDVLMLAALALSVLVGLLRGLVFEVMSLLGWIVAYVVAKVFADAAAAHLPLGAADSAPRHVLAFVGVFIAALVVWSLLSRLLRMAVHATPLSVVDRLLGALFGALRAAVLVLVLATVVGMTPASRWPAWQASRGAAWAQAALEHLKPLLTSLPGEFARYLPA